MTDLLKILEAYEAEATEYKLNRASMHPHQWNERILKLTKALRVALDNLQKYELGVVGYPDMGSGGPAYLARKQIEALLGVKHD